MTWRRGRELGRDFVADRLRDGTARRKVAAPGQADQARRRSLDRLQAAGEAAEPFVVQLADEDVGTLGIVVGRDWSVATHEPADGAPPYLISAGDSVLGPDPLVFFHSGEWTEFPREAAIPIATAREAARSFLRDRELPSNLRWDET